MSKQGSFCDKVQKVVSIASKSRNIFESEIYYIAMLKKQHLYYIIKIRRNLKGDKPVIVLYAGKMIDAYKIKRNGQA